MPDLPSEPELTADVAAHLDLAAGLDDILLVDQHTRLTRDLGVILDLRRGLAAIIARPAPSDALRRTRTLLLPLVRAWFSLRPETRLLQRNQPAVLAAVLQLEVRLVQERRMVDAPQLGRLTLLIAAADALTRSQTEGQWRTPSSERLDEIDRLVVDLGFEADRVRRVLAQMRSAVPLRLHPDLVPPLVAIATLYPAIAAEQVAHDLAIIDWVRNDFTGLDLRRLGPRWRTKIDITGVRWSEATRWPEHLEAWVREESIEIEPGVWEVQGTGPDREWTYVS